MPRANTALSLQALALHLCQLATVAAPASLWRCPRALGLFLCPTFYVQERTNTHRCVWSNVALNLLVPPHEPACC